jgi:hypothetical protein
MWEIHRPAMAMRRHERVLPASLHGLVGFRTRMCPKTATTAWTTFYLHSRSKESG